jgi:hypothetical protein
MRLLSKKPLDYYKYICLKKMILYDDNKNPYECLPGHAFVVDEKDPDAVAQAYGWVMAGHIEPVLIPEKAKFTALKSFELRDDDGTLRTIKKDEIIELGKDLILPLIKKRLILPVNESTCWCPYKKAERIMIPMPGEELSKKKKSFITSWGKNLHPIVGLKKGGKNGYRLLHQNS